MKTKEIIFIIEESLDGVFEAKAVGFPIFTKGETEEEIKKNILEAVRCHFDENEMPSYITIRFLRDETNCYMKVPRDISAKDLLKHLIK